ncbi:hypothetical protein DFR70_10961 [Nocardia tenerifensis]|uniref:Uncharacterized protein n=1 Tax=Nocardia tenerifensis TaxID=228006 RepID=A0A318JWU7_9NOCA|nr:hypothetical protein DFR70_10961 [Nocardia tenerifensis]
MAICFELVINFGDNIDAARAAALTRTTPRPTTFAVGDHHIPLHTALLRADGPFIELSLVPVAVGHRVALDGTIPRFDLTADELTELGRQLYGLLAGFDGYVAAKVGWDPEDMIDPVELRTHWLDELEAGDLDGVVLCDAFYEELGLGDNYDVFRPGYRWVPYRGESPSSLIAD